MSEQEQKLQIDDDWKSQAAAEKERLAETIESPDPQHAQLPGAGFSEIVQLLAMQAMIGLGGMRQPGGQDIPPSLDIAKHHIDLLEVLDEKTSGNLDEKEKRLLDTTLHQLRLAYVEAVRGAAPMPPGV